MVTRKLFSVLLAILFLFQFSCSGGSTSSPSTPAQENTRTIVVYGDSRTDHATHQEVVQAIIRVNPSTVFHTGDLVEDGTDPNQWATFNRIVSDLVKKAKFYPALGNHEKNSRLFFDNFELPNNERWYSVEVDKVHFIVLDSNADISKGSEQYQWLENDLQNINGQIKFVVALFHNPVFSTGQHGGDEGVLRQSVAPLFEQYRVDLVFNGHDHDYERSLYNNIYFIVTGGGGPLSTTSRGRVPTASCSSKPTIFAS